jgi:hypothetical protein
MKFLFLFACYFVSLSYAPGQQITPIDFYNKDYQWSMPVPAQFDSVGAEPWKNIQMVGPAGIEVAYNARPALHTKTLFVYRKGDLNYMEAYNQPFDSIVEGDSLQSCKAINSEILQAYHFLLPDLKIDSSYDTLRIDNINFLAFKTTVTYPNQAVLTVYMFNTLLNKKKLTVSIMYMSETLGTRMLNAFKKSTFGKR